MKKLLYLIPLGLALFAGLAACEKEKEPEAIDTVELRYRANDSYELDAISPQAFVIVVKSTQPWTVKSAHPDWCIISEEEGEAQPDSLVHAGKGENSNIKVQYYDNTSLDDRVDKIEIASYGFIGKTISVYQKGTAYLRVPEDEREFMMEKAKSDVEFNILSNQPWSTAISAIDGNWLTIAEGKSGELNGTVKLSAKENTGEMRYASVSVYDRNGEERAIIKITQDGVLLDPDALEVRAGYDQEASSIHVSSNTKWVVRKSSESDTWFEIVNPDGHDGDGTIQLKFQKNDGSALRRSDIVISNVTANEDDSKVEKTVAVKQAYKIEATRVTMDSGEIGSWSSDWENPPVYTKDVGALFAAKCRLNRSMPFGNYTFRWKDITPVDGAAEAVRVRHWFCFSEGCELKADIRPVDGKVSYDFNAAGDGNKPSIDGFTDVDFTQPVEVTYKFDPSGSEYCHVTYLVNGVEAGSFDTSESLLRTVKWGADINMYIGVDKSGSAVLEWYEYTKPMDWGD